MKYVITIIKDVAYLECPKCGSLVGEPNIHDEWHGTGGIVPPYMTDKIVGHEGDQPPTSGHYIAGPMGDAVRKLNNA